MKSTCKELRERAWNALAAGEGRYWYAVLLLLIVTIIAGTLGSFSFGVITLIALPMTYAYTVEILKLDREGKKPQVESLINVYRNNLEKSFLVSFLVVLFVCLWTLLFIIPGIIMAYAYSMSIFIANDNPELSSMDAIKKSRELMNGHKWELFVLDLSFIGWILLACLTGGIGFIFLQPYMDTAHAEFYRELIGETAAKPANVEEKAAEATAE